MAIGLSLTPRGYNIDTTGKSYTLDPSPLQRAQEKNFALQLEGQKGVYDAAKKGFDFMEYLGARQQLGRVKAQLGELDPNDPAFAKRYSDIILSNPLAFEHASTAPLAKMALAPVTALASSAIEQKYKLEQIAALGKNALAVAGVKGSTSTDNALLRALYGGNRAGAKPDAWLPFQPGGAPGANGAQGAGTGSGLLNLGAAPSNIPAESNIYGEVGTGINNPATETGTGGYPSLPGEGLPTRSQLAPGAPGAPPLLPGIPEGEPTPRFAPEETDVLQTPTTGQYAPRAPFAPAALAPVGEQPPPDFSNIAAPPQDRSLVSATPADAVEDATASPVAQASPQTLAAARARGQLVPIADERGDLWIPTEIGADMKLVRYLPAEKGEEREGYDQIPSKLYSNGVAQEYEYKPKIKATPSEIAKFTDDMKVILDADPDMQRLEMRRDAAKTAYDHALLKFKAIPNDLKGEGTTNADKKQALLPDLEKLGAEANQLSGDYIRYRATRLGEVSRREDPKMAEMMHRDMQVKAEEQMRKKMDDWAAPLLRQHYGMRPEAEEVTAAPSAPSAAEIAPANLTAAQEIEATNPELRGARQAWTDEKVFALKEVKDLTSKLGISEASLLKAIESKDFASINAVVEAAAKRGISSPLFSRQMAGSVAGPTAAGAAPAFALGWSRSAKLGQSYLEILKAAIKDPDAFGKAGFKSATLDKTGKVSSGKSWQAITPFTKTTP